MSKTYETPNMEIILVGQCVIRTSGGDDYDNWETWPT